MDFGIFEMHSYEELKDTPEYQAWHSGDNEASVSPKGESGVQMKKHVLAAKTRLWIYHFQAYLPNDSRVTKGSEQFVAFARNLDWHF